MIRENTQLTPGQTTSSLLDLPPSALRLRFRGGQRHGQVLRIAAAKCSIGSSPGATLRIVCPGVQPIHCLVLRGEGGTVVRRMSADTLLNGNSFDDAFVNPGDHLTLGPIEFEVLDSAAARHQTSSSNERNTSGAAAKLASDFASARLAWEQQRVAQQQRLDDLSRDLDERMRSLDAERTAWQTEQANQQTGQDELVQEIDSLRSQLEQAETLRSQSEEKWSAVRGEIDGELSTTREKLNAKEEEFQCVSNELNELKSQLQSVEEGTNEIEQLRARCDELTRELEGANEGRNQATSERTELSEQLGETQDRLNAKEAEFQAVNGELAALKNQLQSAEEGAGQVEQLRARCEQLGQELDTANQESQRAESQQEQLAAMQAAWDAERSDLQQQLASSLSKTEELQASLQQSELDSATSINQTLGAFEARVNELEQAQQQSREQFESCQQELADAQTQLKASQSEAERQRIELDEARQQLASQRETYEAQMDDLDARRTELEVQQAALQAQETQQPAEFEQATDPHDQNVDITAPTLAEPPLASSDEDGQTFTEGPVTAEPTMAVDMLDRLRMEVGAERSSPVPSMLDNLPTAEAAAQQPADGSEQEFVAEPGDDYTPLTEEQLAFSEPKESAPVDTAAILAQFGHTIEEDELVASELDSPSNETVVQPVEPAPVANVGSGGGEDDSIDDYMTQLMQRVGGGTYEAPQPDDGAKTQTVNAPTEQLTQPVEPPSVENVVPLDPSEFVPRAVAPEASTNLRALRAVANTSTRSAIDKHQRRSFDRNSFLCIFVAIVAGIVCVSMAILAKSVFSLPTLISLVSLVISFLAILKAVSFTAKAKLGKGKRSTQKRLAATTATPAQQPQPQSQQQPPQQ